MVWFTWSPVQTFCCLEKIPNFLILSANIIFMFRNDCTEKNYLVKIWGEIFSFNSDWCQGTTPHKHQSKVYSGICLCDLYCLELNIFTCNWAAIWASTNPIFQLTGFCLCLRFRHELLRLSDISLPGREMGNSFQKVDINNWKILVTSWANYTIFRSYQLINAHLPHCG